MNLRKRFMPRQIRETEAIFALVATLAITHHEAAKRLDIPYEAWWVRWKRYADPRDRTCFQALKTKTIKPENIATAAEDYRRGPPGHLPRKRKVIKQHKHWTRYAA